MYVFNKGLADGQFPRSGLSWKLESIGYIKGSFAVRNGEQYYLIDQRYKKLNADNPIDI